MGISTSLCHDIATYPNPGLLLPIPPTMANRPQGNDMNIATINNNSTAGYLLIQMWKLYEEGQPQLAQDIGEDDRMRALLLKSGNYPAVW